MVLSQIDDLPISVRYSDPTLEMGSIAISRLFLYFYEYLRGVNGHALDPREAFFLLYVLAEKEAARDFRIATLVCPFPIRTRIDYVGKFRAMGLVYSIPHYVAQPATAAQQRPPITRVHHVDWVLDALFYNLSLIYQVWSTKREDLKHATGKLKVFYRLPADFTQTIAIPPHLAAPIAEGKFYRVSQPLRSLAQQLVAQGKGVENRLAAPLARLPAEDLELPLSPSLRSERTRGELSMRQPRTHGAPSVRSRRTALYTTTTMLDLTQISKTFATASGIETYTPTQKEKRQIAGLRRDGFTEEQICAGIVRAVGYAQRLGQSVSTLAYAIPEIRSPREASAMPPERVNEPTGSDAETRSAKTARGKSLVQTGPVSQPQSDRITLEVLAVGDAELLALLQLVQTKNARPLDAGDVTTWRALAARPWVGELAQKSNGSSLGLVTQAVQEAIAAGSVTKDFLAPKLAERILATWRDHGRDAPSSQRPASAYRVQNSTRPSGLQFESLADYQADLERQTREMH